MPGETRDPNCLSDEVVALWLDGALAESERAQHAEHLDACASCRRLLSALVGEGAPRPLDALSGTRVGRFLVRERLGAGGMGVVYAAYDEELHREVALKFVRPGTDPDGGAARLRREARMMARLSHPNVVPVHEVGDYGGGVFIAMERVYGETLGQWLARGPQPAAEVLRRFLQAGEGLAAAHAIGLVHRDFKPDNVLVGVDGRVRVTDFGLARSTQQLEPPEMRAAGVDEAITRPGLRAGTPAYMALEQLIGLPTDARTDQFAFCVALFEALYGEPPFPVGPERKSAVLRNALPRPASTRLGGSTFRAIRKGLRAFPRDRYPSMQALLDALSPQRRRRRLRRAVSAGVLALAVFAGASLARNFHSRPSFCSSSEASLDDVWGRDVERRIETAFLATGKPFAPAAWKTTREKLERYAKQWRDGTARACRGRVAPALLEPQVECLRQARTALKAATALLASANAQIVARAPSSLFDDGLPSLDACAAPVQRAPATHASSQASVSDARAALIPVQLLHAAGEERRASEAIRPVLARTRALGDPASLASALLLAGAIDFRLAQRDDAENELLEAVERASQTADDVTAAKAWTFLAAVYIDDETFGRAHLAVRAGRAAIIRLGGSELLEAGLDGIEASAFRRQADVEQALLLYQAALDSYLRRLGPDDPAVAVARNNLATALSDAGRPAEAVPLARQALASDLAAYGPESPHVAIDRGNLGEYLQMIGQYPEAKEQLEATLGLLQRLYGRDAPNTYPAQVNLAMLLIQTKSFDAALARATEAERIAHSAHLPQELAVALSAEAYVFSQRGKPARALALHREGLAVLESAFGKSTRLLAPVLEDLAATSWELHRPADARAYALRGLQNLGGSGSPYARAGLTFRLAQAESGLGHGAESLRLAREAEAGLRARHPPDAEALAGVRALIARLTSPSK